MNKLQKKFGITIVEVLIVIAIMSVLVTLIVPRLNTVSKDRKIREAARKVGSIFARATQNAEVDGVAGVYFERNPNFIFIPQSDRGLAGDPIRVPYAVNTMYLMRKSPSWSGDFSQYSTATVNGTNQVVIPRPLDHDEANDKFFIQEYDTIFLNNRTFGYSIDSVTEDPGDTAVSPNGSLTLDIIFNDGSATNVASFYRQPDVASGLPFRVERLPRKVESSRVDLPEGYIINLRYSGPVDGGLSFPETVLSGFTTTDDDFAAFYFGRGGTSRFFRTGEGRDTCTNTTVTFIEEDFVPKSSLFFFITEDGLDLEPGQDELQDPDNLWVSVSIFTGNVNVAYNAPQPAPDLSGGEEDPVEFLDRLSNARDIARTRQTATQ